MSQRDLNGNDMDDAPRTTEQSPWLPFESRKRVRDEKRDAVLRTAVRLFLEQGYHRTTLNEVAERLNITKPALYNYFRGKDEILFECWAMGQEGMDRYIAEIDAGGGTGLAKLRKLVRFYAESMTTDYGMALVRFDARDLTADNQKIVRTGKRRVDCAFRKYITEGMADGSIRPCDVKLAAFAIAGSLNWISFWFQRDGALSGEEVATEFVIRLTEGLASERTRKKAPPTREKDKRSSGGSK
jgi:AcrR family transcriptional regulator